ncbi:MAG: ATP-binding cassette domain-containing protein [Nocardioides sp.]
MAETHDTDAAPDAAPDARRRSGRLRHRAERSNDGSVAVRGLGRRFGDKWVVEDVSFDVPAGAFLSIVGPSGCGKSTTLRMLAGLDRPDGGEITIGGELVSSARGGVSVPAERRNIGFVFQSYALWPHMSVFDHVAYPLASLRLSKPDLRRRVEDTLATVGLEGYRAASPRSSAAASNSGSHSPAPSSRSPPPCCSTSRSATSTPPSADGWPASCGLSNSASGSPRSTSPTTGSRHCRCRTR